MCIMTSFTPFWLFSLSQCHCCVLTNKREIQTLSECPRACNERANEMSGRGYHCVIMWAILKKCIEHRIETCLLKLKYSLHYNFSTKHISFACKKSYSVLKKSCYALSNDSQYNSIPGVCCLSAVSIIRSLVHRKNMFLSFLTNTSL